jgi:hypothetical protein
MRASKAASTAMRACSQLKRSRHENGRSVLTRGANLRLNVCAAAAAKQTRDQQCKTEQKSVNKRQCQKHFT